MSTTSTTSPPETTSELPLPALRWYACLSRLRGLRSYSGKLFLVSFIGTHIPLLTLIGVLIFRPTVHSLVDVRLIVLMGTALGAVLTLMSLHHLLMPMRLAARALQAYRESGELPHLPMRFSDEAGQLMADTQRTLTTLDEAIHLLTDRDALTGLPNRDSFIQRLTARIADVSSGGGFAVVLVRVTDLGEVNLALGRTAGDELLRDVAARLGDALGGDLEPHDLARVGSAEFCLIVPRGVALPTENAARFLGRVEAALAQPVAGVSRPRLIPLRAGVAVFPEDVAGAAHTSGETTAAALLRAAEVAVQSASPPLATPGHWLTWAVFTPERDGNIRRRMQLEQDLYGACLRGEMYLHYQPLVANDSGHMMGVEALLRWRHPTLGAIAPNEFIPIAESSGVIVEIGEWVIRTACGQLGRWGGQGLPELKVAVNLSAGHFAQPGLVPLALEVLKENNLSPSQLELEVTESLFLSDAPETLSTLQALRRAGIALALDDFGIGYASLSRLQRYPFDTLKIDRSFVSDLESNPESQRIVSAIIALAQSMCLGVIAEGVETEAQRERLNRSGCKMAQGYLFGRPVEPDEIAARLRAAGPYVASGTAIA